MVLAVRFDRPTVASERDRSPWEMGAATVEWAAFLLVDADDDPRFERAGCNRSTRGEGLRCLFGVRQNGRGEDRDNEIEARVSQTAGGIKPIKRPKAGRIAR